LIVLDKLVAQGHPPVGARLDRPIGELWRERVALHFHDAYAGVPMTKFPEDLRVYEHLLWASAPRVVIEIGVHHGASELWFRDRVRDLERYRRTSGTRYVGVDIDIEARVRNLDSADASWRDSITLVAGDICDDGSVASVRAAVPDGSSCLVVEDSAHVYDTTLASLRGLASLLRPGGFFVVEDGCVDLDDMRYEADWPRGVLAAVDSWLASPQGVGFVRRRDLELYGLTCHPGGFLQRRP
jgi:cephalosporin hydroxylase